MRGGIAARPDQFRLDSVCSLFIGRVATHKAATSLLSVCHCAGQKCPARAGQTEEAKDTQKGDTGFKAGLSQLLGIRGGDAATNIWRIRVQLTKPVTWVPLIWGETYVQ